MWSRLTHSWNCLSFSFPLINAASANFDYLVDKNIPIETTLKVLDEEYVKTGKIGGIGLSEVSADTIERAVKVCKIVAVEVEVSLWATDIFSNGVAQACARHNLPIVAYVQ